MSSYERGAECDAIERGMCYSPRKEEEEEEEEEEGEERAGGVSQAMDAEH